MGKPLIDYTDEELRAFLRADSEHVIPSSNDALHELDRRSQDRHSRALRFQGWAVIALTIVVAVAGIAQAVASVVSMMR